MHLSLTEEARDSVLNTYWYPALVHRTSVCSVLNAHASLEQSYALVLCSAPCLLKADSGGGDVTGCLILNEAV